MTQTAKNYGDALYELARDEALCPQISEELAGVCGLFADMPAYTELLSAPSVPKSERTAVLDAAFSGRVHPYVLNFLKLLTERDHIRELKDCGKQFRSRYNEDRGILAAVAVTAVPLTDALMQKLRAKLCAVTGKQVEIQNRVDPSVLGGIRLEMEGRQLDGTVRQRLDGLKKTLSDTVL